MSITVTTNDGVESPTETSAQDAGEQSETLKAESGEGGESEAPNEDEETEEVDESEEGEESDEQSEEEEEVGDDDESEEDEEKSDKKGKKRRSGWKRRLDREKRKQEALVNQNQELLSRLEALEKVNGQTDTEETQSQGNKKAFKTDESAPIEDDYDDYGEYLEAKTEWKARKIAEELLDKREKEREERSAQSKAEKEISAKVGKFQQDCQKLGEEIEDFKEVLEDVDDIPPSLALKQALLESDMGARIIYELASDPEEYRRVNALSEKGVLKALGRLEAKIEFSEETSTQKPKRKTSKAPKPLEKVGARGKAIKRTAQNARNQREFEEAIREGRY